MKVLFVTYNTIDTATCRFRTYFPVKYLNKAGAEARASLVYFTGRKDIDWADIVVFQRIPQAAWYFHKLHLPAAPILSRIQSLFEYAQSKKRVGIDSDDYIFLPNDGLATGVPQQFLQNLISKSHFVTASTNPLAKHLRAINSNVHVMPNALDFWVYESHRASIYINQLKAQASKLKERGLAVAGWICGKNHEQDLPLFLKIADETNLLSTNISFLVIGGKKMRGVRWPENVITTQMIHWRELHQVVKLFDINIIPLEDSIRNECKSELKLLEAGFCGIPSVVSAVGVYKEIVGISERHGLIGDAPRDFAVKLIELSRSSEKRRLIGNQIRDYILQNYSAETRAGEYLNLFQNLQNYNV